MARRDSISWMVQQKCQRLLDLSKKVVDCQLEEGKKMFPASFVTFSSPGMFCFSIEREAALSELIKELRPMMTELKNKDERTFAQRCLKKNLMTSPHDLRGSRRLSLIFSLMKVRMLLISLNLPISQSLHWVTPLNYLSVSGLLTLCMEFFVGGNYVLSMLFSYNVFRALQSCF